MTKTTGVVLALQVVLSAGCLSGPADVELIATVTDGNGETETHRITTRG